MALVEISLWTPSDVSIAAATELLHRAYGTHRTDGILFGAATQDEATTRRRIETATATWGAWIDERLVGVISYYDHRRYRSEPVWYKHNYVGHFGQFAVEPDEHGRGIGGRLLEKVQGRAIRDGKNELSCDTACTATNLVAFYVRLGFRDVGRHQWRGQPYQSIVLSKKLN